MKDFDINDYKPLIDTTTLSDDEIELWYGSKFAVRFLRMIEGCEIKYDFDIYLDRIYYFKDDKYMFEYDLKNEWFWVSYSNIWSILESEFDYNYQKVKQLPTDILEQHFKQKVVTTFVDTGVSSDSLEQHFKQKVVTTNSEINKCVFFLEQHFKQKVVTTPVKHKRQMNNLEQHFKQKVVTTCLTFTMSCSLLEQHFKQKVVTTILGWCKISQGLEQHFKQKVVTTERKF